MMRAVVVLSMLAGIAFSATPESALKSARAYLARGDRSVTLAGRLETPLQRVRALQRAKPSYKWAIRKAMDGLGKAEADVRASLEQARVKATRALLSILNAETALYHANRQSSLAAKRNAEALELAPSDAEAIHLKQVLATPAPVAATPPAPRRAEAVALSDRVTLYRDCTWTRWRGARFWRHGDTRFLTRPPARVAPVRRAPFKSAPRAASGAGLFRRGSGRAAIDPRATASGTGAEARSDSRRPRHRRRSGLSRSGRSSNPCDRTARGHHAIVYAT